MPPAALVANRAGGHRATEIKSVDVATATSNYGSLGIFTALNIPVEGAAFYNRIGRRIQMKSLHFNGFIIPTLSNANAVTTTYARTMIVYDRQANGAAPALADLILAYTSAGATSSQTLDGLNMNNRDRFQILMDEKVCLPPLGINGATAASTAFTSVDINQNAQHAGGRININRFLKLRGLETHYKASAGTIGDIATGALLLFTLSTDAGNGGGANTAYEVQYTARLKFYD